MYVPKFFEMDPETDDLLFDGYDLKRGMVVLIATDYCRQDMNQALEPFEKENADRFNRWCTVLNIPQTSEGHVAFIALYDDGTKKKIVVPTTHAWYVRKTTMNTDHSSCFQREKVDWAPIGIKNVEETPEDIKIVDAGEKDEVNLSGYLGRYPRREQ